MSKSGIFSRIKNTLYGGLIASAMGLGACEDPVVPPRTHSPVNSLSVSPQSGTSPLEVRIIGNCTDADNDIREYRVTSGTNTITTSNPVDTTFTITGPSSFSSNCEDMEGNRSQKGPFNVNVTQPVNNLPQNVTSVSPMSGVAPLRSRVQFSCTDQDGLQDIISSGLVVGNDTLRVTSADSTFTFNNPTIVSSYCVDSKGASSSRGPFNVNVTQPDYLNLSGRLEDVRTGTGSAGKGAVYTYPDKALVGKFNTDGNGNFSFNLDSLIAGDSLYLQLRQEVGNPSNNFVRTIVIPNRDKSNIVARAYPYTSALSSNGITREQFLSHLQEINPGYDKWNLQNLLGIEIVDVDPLGRGSFTSAEQNAIEATFSSNLACYTGGRLTNVNIQKDNPSTPQRHYTSGSNGLVLESNWIYVFPDTTIIPRGLTGNLIDGNGWIYNAVIRIKNLSQFVSSHEEGHSLQVPNNNHATTIPGTVTIMRGDVQSPLNSPGPADCEAGEVINEETFNPREAYERTMGLNFFPQYFN